MAKENKTHVCVICKKAFDCRNDLRRHERTHSGEKPHACGQCTARFSQSVALRNHMMSIHSGSRPFLCGDCGKSFAVKERLRLHVRIHTGEKPYNCSECPKRFARCGQLAQHKRMHAGHRPFKCKLCKAEFTSSGNLKVHLKRHLGLKEFSCEVCGKSFTRRDGLQKHLSCFHGGEKPFECSICKKRYKGHLMQHFRTHLHEKPHSCDQCSARFVQRSQLTVHMRIHTGEKPYPCKECGRRFAHSTALKLHIRRHTGEKPFRCPICPSTSFVQLPHLKKHMRCIHKTDKPYLCTRCQTFFKKKVELDSHQETCRSDENLPPGKCSNGTQTDPTMEIEVDEEDEDGNLADYEVLFPTKAETAVVEEKAPTKPSSPPVKPSGRRNKTSPRLTSIRSRNGTQESSNGTDPVAVAKPTPKRKTTRLTSKSNITTTSNANTSMTPPKAKKQTKVIATKVAVVTAAAKATPVTLKIRKTRLLSVRNVQSIVTPPTSPTTRSSKGRVIKSSPSSVSSDNNNAKVIPKMKTPKSKPTKSSPSKSISEPYIPKISANDSVFPPETEASSVVGIAHDLSLQDENESPTPSMEVPAPMTIDQMRSLVGELLQKISTPERLQSLGFGTRAIDDVLHDSISTSGRKPCEEDLSIPEKLRKNVDILLEWTIPPQFMTKFRKEQRTTEELLEELTS